MEHAFAQHDLRLSFSVYSCTYREILASPATWVGERARMGLEARGGVTANVRCTASGHGQRQGRLRR